MLYAGCCCCSALQFPSAFEFNSRYLLCLSDHLYSCRFGTLLFNCEKERREANLKERCASLWTYLEVTLLLFLILVLTVTASHAKQYYCHCYLSCQCCWYHYYSTGVLLRTNASDICTHASTDTTPCHLLFMLPQTHATVNATVEQGQLCRAFLHLAAS
jgi:Myotubularin-like phosphatase domain